MRGVKNGDALVFLREKCNLGKKTRRGGAWGAPPRRFTLANVAPSGLIGVPVRVDGGEVLPFLG